MSEEEEQETDHIIFAYSKQAAVVVLQKMSCPTGAVLAESGSDAGRELNRLQHWSWAQFSILFSRQTGSVKEVATLWSRVNLTSLLICGHALSTRR